MISAVVIHTDKQRAVTGSCMERGGKLDTVVLALPLNRLHALTLPIPNAVRAALAAVEQADAIKIAFESPTELDSLSGLVPHNDCTNAMRLQWPDTAGAPVQRIVALYANGQASRGLLMGTQAQQVATAKSWLNQRRADQLKELLAPLVVQWSRIPHQQAAAARAQPRHAGVTQALSRGFAPVFIAGDALSGHNGWQEGAVGSGLAAAHAVRRFLR